MNQPVKSYLVLLLIAIFFISCQQNKTRLVAKQVIVIGVDGMSPDGVKIAKTPVMDALMKQGASSLKARAVMPSSSGPNWGSMILGAGPEQHGITSNAWRVDSFTIEATVKDEDGYFPSMFDLVREAMPKAKIGLFHDWSALNHFFNNKSLDVIMDTHGPDTTMQEAIKFIINQKPTLTFIHLDHVDHAGHAHQHGSSEYYQSVVKADSLIGDLVKNLKANNLYENTHLLITSDHGGKGYGHGGNSMEEMEIPWIICGEGVRNNHTIKAPIDTYNTAATVLYLFNVKIPNFWVGHPVLEAFDSAPSS